MNPDDVLIFCLELSALSIIMVVVDLLIRAVEVLHRKLLRRRRAVP